MKKFFGEFKEFISKGSVMDLAIGMIVGSTFTKIVNSVVSDILTPLVSLFTGKTSFADMFISLDGNTYATLEQAREAQATVIAYGNVLQTLIDFLLTALLLFFIVKALNKLRRVNEKLKSKDKKEEDTEKSEEK